MNLVVVGLSPREEAAFGFFISRTMPTWTWQSVPGGRGAVLPQSDMVVADLVSLGLAQWSDEAEANLIRLLQGTPAVLLVSTHDRSWSGKTAFAAQHSLAWLAKPYGTKDMQAALEKTAAVVELAAQAFVPVPGVRARVQRPVPVTATPLPAASIFPVTVQPESEVAEVAPAPLVVDVTEVLLPAALAAQPQEMPGLTATDLQARLLALPDETGYAFLRQLSTMLTQAHPFEVRFTVQNSLIVHPEDGWVATNTPMTVIGRVCQSDALASAVDFRAIDGAQAEERLERLGMPLAELDAFLLELVSATLDKQSQATSASHY